MSPIKPEDIAKLRERLAAGGFDPLYEEDMRLLTSTDDADKAERREMIDECFGHRLGIKVDDIEF